MNDPALPVAAAAGPPFPAGPAVPAGSAGRAGRRRRPTRRDADRLTDALRVTRAVLRRLASRGGTDAGDIEALRSAIDAADAVLGGPA
jgi:hypothetical protein